MYQNNSNFVCLVENGIIFQVDTYNKIPVGRTNEEYDKLNEITKEYYEKLVQLGAIVPPKTQEEINAELQKSLKESQEFNVKLASILENLQNKLDGKKGDVENESESNQAEVSTTWTKD